MAPNRSDFPLRLESKDLVIEELPNELMIYDPARKKAFCLNETAGFVWQHANGKRSVTEIARLLAVHLGHPVDEQVVRYALQTLSKDGLLADEAELPQVSPEVTRRALLQRIGIGAAASVPLVTALMVAPAKAHASSKWDPPSYGGGHGRGGHGGGWPW